MMVIGWTYQRDSRLQLFVPVEMEEVYGLDIEVVHGRANYRNYRRFETAGGWSPIRENRESHSPPSAHGR